MKKVVTSIKSQEVDVKNVSTLKFYGGIKDNIENVCKIFIVKVQDNYVCLIPPYLTSGGELISLTTLPTNKPVFSISLSGLIQQLSNFTFYEFDTYQELFQWLSTNLN